MPKSLPLDPSYDYPIAFAALRYLAMAGSFVVVVEDLATVDLLAKLPASTRALFVSNLRQLGCGHLTAEDSRHSARKVINLVDYAVQQAKALATEDVTSVLASQLRGLVDRDICPSYSPLAAANGTEPPSKHAADLSRILQLRSTPLNDIESTFFANDIGSLLAALDVIDIARVELRLPVGSSGSKIGQAFVREWLVPLFCVRSFFMRQSPALSSKGISALIGIWALPQLVADSGPERGVQIAQSVPNRPGALLPPQLDGLRAELDAADAAQMFWAQFVHGHDLMQILGMLRAQERGDPSIPMKNFTDNSNGGWYGSPGMCELRKREHEAFETATAKFADISNEGLMAFANGLF